MFLFVPCFFVFFLKTRLHNSNKKDGNLRPYMVIYSCMFSDIALLLIDDFSRLICGALSALKGMTCNGNSTEEIRG